MNEQMKKLIKLIEPSSLVQYFTSQVIFGTYVTLVRNSTMCRFVTLELVQSRQEWRGKGVVWFGESLRRPFEPRVGPSRRKGKGVTIIESVVEKRAGAREWKIGGALIECRVDGRADVEEKENESCGGAGCEQNELVAVNVYDR